MILNSDRLSTILFSKEHLQDFLKFYNQETTMKYVQSGKYKWTENELLNKLNHIKINNGEVYSILLKENNNQVIGELSLFKSTENPEVLEIGYIINSEYTGKGYAFEIINQLFLYNQSSKKFKRIIANINKENIPSLKLCTKLKMIIVEERQIENIYRLTFSKDFF